VFLNARGDDLLTVGQAAGLLDLHPRTVRRWIDEGRLASVEVFPTRRVRVRREDVEAARSPKYRDR